MTPSWPTFSTLQRTLSKTNTMRSGGASKALWKQRTVPPRPVCHWHCRLYIGCPVFPWDLSYHVGIPTMFASPTGSVAPHSSTSSLARSCSRTQPHGTSLVRSCSHSESSTGSHAAVPESPAGSGGQGHEYSKSTSQDGDGTDDKSVAGSDDEAPRDDEHQAGESSNSTSSSSDVKEADRSCSEAEGSTSQSSQSSSESDGEMPVCAAAPSKETGKDTATKEAKTSVPSPSWLPPDADSKVTEAEWKYQRCKDAWHLYKHFGTWHDRMLSEGCTGWKECYEMHYENEEPFKELQN